MRSKRFPIAIFCLFLFESTAHASDTAWLHLRIEEAGTGETVKVNLPLSVVETLLPLVQEKHLTESRARLQEKGFTVSELRAMWKTLRAEGDVMLAEMQSSGTDFQVFIEDDSLHVRSKEGAKENIDIRIPAPVLDALLSGQGEEINLLAAVQALQQMGTQEIVSIRDGNKTIRVWVD